VGRTPPVRTLRQTGITHGHFQREVSPDRRAGGITTRSVEHEREWRSQATLLGRLRRVLGYAFVGSP